MIAVFRKCSLSFGNVWHRTIRCLSCMQTGNLCSGCQGNLSYSVWFVSRFLRADRDFTRTRPSLRNVAFLLLGIWYQRCFPSSFPISTEYVSIFRQINFSNDLTHDLDVVTRHKRTQLLPDDVFMFALQKYSMRISLYILPIYPHIAFINVFCGEADCCGLV